VREKLHKITVGDYGLYSKSGSLFRLKKHGINKNNIAELNGLVDAGLLGKEDMSVQISVDKLISKCGILQLEMLFDAIYHLISLESELDIYCKTIGKEPGEKKSKQFIDKVFEISQITIDTIEDVKKIKHEIKRRKDMYVQQFPKVQEQKGGVTFMQIVFSVFRNNGFDKIDYNMVLSDFFELKDMIPKQKENGGI